MIEQLKEIVKVTFDQVGLCGLWQATHASYTVYEAEAGNVDWASPWENQSPAMLEGAYESSFAVWEDNGRLPYFLVLGASSYQEIDLAEQPLPPTRESESDDEEDDGYVAIGRPTAFLRQQKDIEDTSDNSHVFAFDRDAASATSKLKLYGWNDGDEAWQCDIVRLDGDELVRWSYTTYQWIYVQSIETRYRRG